MRNPFWRNTKTEKHFGGGNRPWIGNFTEVKVESVGNGKLTLSYDVADPPDIEAGNEYLAMFRDVRHDGGDGGAAKSAGG